MEFKYRRARQLDCEDVLKLQDEWFSENITHGYQPEMLDSMISKINEFYYIAECELGIIGFVSASVHEAKGMAIVNDGEMYIEIEDIFVSSEYRDQGVGGKLVDIVMGEAHSKGIERALIYSATKDLDRVVDFYRKNGFKTWYVQMFK
jgi:ribosomal protein S18 acetylase RimI-like enzyme